MNKIIVVIALFLMAQLSYGEMVVTVRLFPVYSNYYDYYAKLIETALEKTRPTYGDYTLSVIKTDSSLLRVLGDVAADVHPNMLLEFSYDNNLTRSGALTYIEFPIDGGILGYRVCFVRPGLKDKIKNANSLDDLRQYTIGQGFAWADSEILRANGFKVIEVANFKGIYKMLVAGRIDLFCRGANQIKSDLEEFKELTKLTYDESFLLVYPLPRFFYLHKKNQLLKQRMMEGLKIAFEDGSLKKMWDDRYKDNLNFVKLSKRKVYHLKNPLLSNLNQGYQQYFFDPLHSF